MEAIAVEIQAGTVSILVGVEQDIVPVIFVVTVNMSQPVDCGEGRVLTLAHSGRAGV